MIGRALSYVFEIIAVGLLAVIIFGLSGSLWWTLVPVAIYAGLLSFLIDGGRR